MNDSVSYDFIPQGRNPIHCAKLDRLMVRVPNLKAYNHKLLLIFKKIVQNNSLLTIKTIQCTILDHWFSWMMIMPNYICGSLFSPEYKKLLLKLHQRKRPKPPRPEVIVIKDTKIPPKYNYTFHHFNPSRQIVFIDLTTSLTEN